MKPVLLLASALYLVSLGCQPVVVNSAPTEAKKVDIHIKTPRADVDVEKKKDGNTDVDVTKNR